jgi:hypothetical protein
MRKLLIIILAFAAGVPVVQGQDPAQSWDYGKEISWGVTKATNSGLIGGFLCRMSIRRSDESLHYFGIEIVNVKHPKEERFYSFTGNTYIYGKSNYLYNLRTYYGREWILFRKAPQQGVQVDGIVSGGPTFGIVAPYYIEYLESDGDIVREQYDYQKHNNRESILGTGNLFQGLGQSTITPGLNLKTALSFEFGSVRYSVVGIETGFMLEMFAKPVPIIPTAEQYQVFPNAFITLFYGSRK